MSKVFELVHDDDNMAVIKVNAKDPLTVAMNPYIDGDWEYITVTKGDNHTLRVTRTNGTTWSFFWGLGGHTLIGPETEMLRKQVVKFINDNNIYMGNFWR